MANKKPSKEKSAVALEINESDFDRSIANRIQGIADGRQELSADSTLKRVVFDALPKVIASRVEAAIPEGFTVQEIEFNISVSGKPFGIGVGGDVKVRMGPSKKKE